MKKVSTLVGILIILAAAILLFGGVFAWQYYNKPHEANTVTNKVNDLNNNVPLFENYAVTTKFIGEIAPVDYSSNENAYNFRGQIKEQVKNGVNFAGHYIVVTWGCGTDCQAGVIVNAVDGKVYNLPFTTTVASCGLKFNTDSSLFITDADQSCVNGFNLSNIRTRYYNWENNKFTEIVIEATDWKTYTNNMYGVKLQYPSTYKIYEYTSNTQEPQTIFVNPNILLNVAYWNGGGTDARSVSQKNILVDGNNAIERAYTNSNQQIDSIIISLDNINNDNQRHVAIIYTPNPDNNPKGDKYLTEKDLQDFDKIVSTFKFTK